MICSFPILCLWYHLQDLCLDQSYREALSYRLVRVLQFDVLHLDLWSTLSYVKDTKSRLKFILIFFIFYFCTWIVQHCLLKRIFFFGCFCTCIKDHSVKFYVGVFLGFLSCSIHLCHPILSQYHQYSRPIISVLITVALYYIIKFG